MSVRVIVVRPGHSPTVEEIAGDLQSLQDIVGGYVEFVLISDRPGVADLYCNEDGRARELAPNRAVPSLFYTVIRGTFLIAAHTRTEELRSFTSDECAAWLAAVANWRVVEGN